MAYEVQWRLLGHELLAGSDSDIETEHYDVVGLSPATDYEWRVREMGGVWSVWAAFQTLAPIYLFFGTITDKNGNPAERRVTVLNSAGECMFSGTSDPATGYYEIPAPENAQHTLVFDGEPDRNAIVYGGVYPSTLP